MSSTAVTLHLDIIGFNSAGTLFGNAPARLVVLRWKSADNLAEMLALVEMAFTETRQLNADALIYDMRLVPEAEGLVNDEATRLHCIAHSRALRFISLTSKDTADVRSPDMRELGNVHSLKYAICTSFEEAAIALDSFASHADSPLINQKPALAHFFGSFAGCCYALPEYNTTVLRFSGDIVDRLLLKELFEATFVVHQKASSSVLILDSTSTPPIRDMERYSFIFEGVIAPLKTAGVFNQIIHVRSGDPLVPEGVPPLAPVVVVMDIPYYEVPFFRDAISLLRVLQGKPELAKPAGVLDYQAF